MSSIGQTNRLFLYLPPPPPPSKKKKKKERKRTKKKKKKKETQHRAVCVLNGEGSWVFTGAVVIWTAVYLTGYDGCLTVSMNHFSCLTDLCHTG